MAKKKYFNKFPEVMYLVRDESEGKENGYYLDFEDEAEAAEYAEGVDSEVAAYQLASHAVLRVEKSVVEID